MDEQSITDLYANLPDNSHVNRNKSTTTLGNNAPVEKKEAGDEKRAEKIVENNLCLFMPDGTASCAYIYPRRVNGKPGKFFDSYANDQDWALAYYLQVKENIW